MIGVCKFSSPLRLRRMLVHPASGWLVVWLLWPVGLAGQETGQVTLYTPDGSQQRTLSVPLLVDVGLPRPMEAPVSAAVGTGTGTRITDVEVVVSDSAGGHETISYADGRILGLVADASGHVWVGTTTGLSRFDGQQWTTFTHADGLADDVIAPQAVDGQGQMWAGNWKGLSRFDGQRWTRYRFEGLWGDVVAVAPNGDVWCTGYGDVLLTRFDGQDWWTYDHDDMGIANSDPWWAYTNDDMGIVESEESFHRVHVIEIAFDRSGTLWATLQFWNQSEWNWPRPLSFNGVQWTSYQFDAWMIFPDSQGRVWMSCINGLCVKDGSTWKRYDTIGTGDYRRWRVGEMTEDAAGRLWIAEGGYFGVLEGTTWTGFPYEEFRADVFVPPVIDSREDLWIPSWDGLYRWHHSDLPTAIESSATPSEPRSFRLEQNFPNPFNHATHIGFTLQQSAIVSMQVFNIHGQLVATLAEGTRPAGTYQTAWDGRDAQGQAVSSGAYIVRLDAGGQQATHKMMLIQ